MLADRLATPASSTRKHVLAGDDSAAVRDLVREVLETEGYRVSLSAAPLDLETVKRVAPDLVILDFMIDDGAGSGWSLIDALRADPATRDLPIVACTGAVQQVREQRWRLDLNGVHVVLKPFDIDDLLTAVQQCGKPLPVSTELSASPSAPD